MTGCIGRSWLVGVLVACALLFAACSEGYPTDDALILSPAQMSMDQRVSSMNRIGDRAGLAQKWRYSMHPGCVLRVAAPGSDLARQSVALLLDNVRVVMRLDATDKTYEIHLERGTNSSSTLQVLLFDGGKWVDAVQIRSLVHFLQKGCADAARSGS